MRAGFSGRGGAGKTAVTYRDARVEREGNAAKIGRREGQTRARNKMLDCPPGQQLPAMPSE